MDRDERVQHVDRHGDAIGLHLLQAVWLREQHVQRGERARKLKISLFGATEATVAQFRGGTDM